MYFVEFSRVSRLNINLDKSELVRSGDGRDASALARGMRCKSVELLIK